MKEELVKDIEKKKELLQKIVEKFQQEIEKLKSESNTDGTIPAK